MAVTLFASLKEMKIGEKELACIAAADFSPGGREVKIEYIEKPSGFTTFDDDETKGPFHRAFDIKAHVQTSESDQNEQIRVDVLSHRGVCRMKYDAAQKKLKRIAKAEFSDKNDKRRGKLAILNNDTYVATCSEQETSRYQFGREKEEEGGIRCGDIYKFVEKENMSRLDVVAKQCTTGLLATLELKGQRLLTAEGKGLRIKQLGRNVDYYNKYDKLTKEGTLERFITLAVDQQGDYVCLADNMRNWYLLSAAIIDGSTAKLELTNLGRSPDRSRYCTPEYRNLSLPTSAHTTAFVEHTGSTYLLFGLELGELVIMKINKEHSDGTFNRFDDIPICAPNGLIKKTWQYHILFNERFHLPNVPTEEHVENIKVKNEEVVKDEEERKNGLNLGVVNNSIKCLKTWQEKKEGDSDDTYVAFAWRNRVYVCDMKNLLYRSDVGKKPKVYLFPSTVEALDVIQH